ncbi:hypothetical protein MD484_g5025, partial [Candolleomyces efflorescens]
MASRLSGTPTDSSSERDVKDAPHQDECRERIGSGEDLDSGYVTEIEDIPGVRSWTSTGPYLCLPEEGKMTPEQSWPLCAELALQADKDKNESIRDQINQDLVFASLFSAVVASFVLESSKLLRVDQGEVAALLLLHIHHQLDSLIRQNASAQFPVLLSDEDLVLEPPQYAVAVDSLWLLSLTISLGTAMLGIVCLIFLRPHDGETRAAPREVVRHLYSQKERRRKMGVSLWQRMLRPMLLLSLALFTIGLLIFHSEINVEVGLIYNVSITLSILAIAYAGPVHARFQTRTRRMALREGNGAALGLVWVAQRFPQAVRAIYAFLHSTEGVTPELGKALLHELYQSARFKDLHLAQYLNVDPTATRWSDELHRDVFAAYVLDRFAVDSSKESGLQAALVGHRFELLLRILNGADAYAPPGEIPSRRINPPSIGLCQAQIRNFALAFFSNGDSVVRCISRDCRIQYCELVWRYIRDAGIHRVSFLLSQHPVPPTHQEVFLKFLVPGSKGSPWNMDHDVLQHVCALNRRVAQLLTQGSDKVVTEHVAKAIVYVTQIFNTISTNSSEPDIAYCVEIYKTTHPEYMNSIIFLVQSVVSSGVPVDVLDDLLETSEKEGWRRVLMIHRNYGSRLSPKGGAIMVSGDAVIDMF